MIEEKTFKWVEKKDYYKSCLLVWAETERLIATIEHNSHDDLWNLYYQGKTESFLNKEAAMKYAEDAVKTPVVTSYKYFTPSLPEGCCQKNALGKVVCPGCQGVGTLLSMTDTQSTSGMAICQCPVCNGTGVKND
jgi:hypothetical protein